MSAARNLPAFPGIGFTRNDAFPSEPIPHEVKGMTLRDFFIAHAPTEPQPWFSPVMPQPEAPLPTFAEMYRDHTPEELRALSNFSDEWMQVEDVKQERVRNYLFQQQEQHKRGRQRAATAERERYIQWPAAWADAMLAARQGGAA